MPQTIFSDEYCLPGTPETKNPGAPTTGTTTSIRSNSTKFGFFDLKSEMTPIGTPGGLEGENKKIALATGDGGVGS